MDRPTVTNSQPNRLLVIDQSRGIAIILMAIFHFCYNLSVFGFITFETNGGFFTWFRFVIVTLFFSSVGASLFLAHQHHIQWQAFWFRLLKITTGAAIITVSTLIMYPTNWVYFGVLHFIVLASFAALPFVHWPKTAGAIGLGIFILYNTTGWFNLNFVYPMLKDTLNLPRGTLDLTRFLPWYGMVLMGIYLGSIRYGNMQAWPLGALNRPILLLSKHSLLVYLIHQPLLFGIAFLIYKTLNS